jgi:hypothetical protein
MHWVHSFGPPAVASRPPGPNTMPNRLLSLGKLDAEGLYSVVVSILDIG